MDIHALEILGAIATAVTTALGIILAFSVRAARQGQSALADSIKALQQDREFYRGEMLKSNQQVAALQGQIDAIHRDQERQQKRLESRIEQLEDQLRASQQNRAALQTELDASRQREIEMKTEIDTLKVEKMAMQQEIMTLRADIQMLREKLEARDAPKANGQVAVANEVNGP